MAEETSFYSDNSGVRVTDKRVILKDTTYALANIASVSTNVEDPSLTGPIITIVLGLILLFGGFSGHGTGGYVIVGLVAIGLGVVWWKGCKPIWHLRIASASGEATPLKSTNKQWIASIAQAINEAIIHRA